MSVIRSVGWFVLDLIAAAAMGSAIAVAVLRNAWWIAAFDAAWLVAFVIVAAVDRAHSLRRPPRAHDANNITFSPPTPRR